MVFAGKVVGFEYRKGIPNQYMESRIKDSGKHIDWETLVVKFQVERWWKGEAALEIFLVTDETKNSDGTVTNSSCNYKFKEGESYLVYAYGKESELRTNVCSGTGALAEAKEVLEILGEGKEPVEKKDEPNKLLDVRAGAATFLSRRPLNFELREFGFASRQLSSCSLFIGY